MVLAVFLSVLTLTPIDSALDVIPRTRRSLGNTAGEASPRWCRVTQEGPDHRVSLLSCPGYWSRGAPLSEGASPRHQEHHDSDQHYCSDPFADRRRWCGHPQGPARRRGRRQQRPGSGSGVLFHHPVRLPGDAGLDAHRRRHPPRGRGMHRLLRRGPAALPRDRRYRGPGSHRTGSHRSTQAR